MDGDSWLAEIEEIASSVSEADNKKINDEPIPEKISVYFNINDNPDAMSQFSYDVLKRASHRVNNSSDDIVEYLNNHNHHHNSSSSSSSGNNKNNSNNNSNTNNSTLDAYLAVDEIAYYLRSVINPDDRSSSDELRVLDSNTG